MIFFKGRHVGSRQVSTSVVQGFKEQPHLECGLCTSYILHKGWRELQSRGSEEDINHPSISVDQSDLSMSSFCCGQHFWQAPFQM